MTKQEDMRRAGAASQIDLLSAKFTSPNGLSLNGGAFTVSRPWGRASFGSRMLRRGWWKLEYVSDRGETAEVSLSSFSDPLIVFPANAADAVRIFLREASPYAISLLVSPWPGKYEFKSLRLRKLGFVEQWLMLASRAAKLLSQDKPLTRVCNAFRRLSTGAAVGLRTSGSNEKPQSRFPQSNAFVRCATSYVTTDVAGIRVITRNRDRLHPDAIGIVKGEFEARPQLHAIYADVLEIDSIVPRPQWDDDLATSCDVFSAPVFLRASSSATGTPADILRGIAGSAGVDAIGRIALPLLARDDVSSEPLEQLPVPELTRRPLVSVLIPTKYQTELLARCLDGLASSGYAEIEVVVVDNGSDDPDLRHVLADAARRMALLALRDVGEFNFSRLMNFAASKASGELLLLLNDDVEALEPGWLDRLVESALRPEVGAVGARLVYPDGTIQHAGVVMGIAGTCGHLWKHWSADEALRNPLIVRPGRRAAVTGACLMVRKALYERLGGLDEAFPVNYGDIDFCLRLQAQGLRNIYRGDAVLVHHESKSTGTVPLDSGRLKREAMARREFLRRWRAATLDDPCGSPAFDPSSESGLIRRALRLTSGA